MKPFGINHRTPQHRGTAIMGRTVVGVYAVMHIVVARRVARAPKGKT